MQYLNSSVVLLMMKFESFTRRIGTRIVLWTEQQEEELQMLYEEFRDSDGKGAFRRPDQVKLYSLYLTEVHL